MDGSPVSFRHPADAILAGVVYVAADRAEALLMQRSVRENIALPSSARIRRWGPIDLGREATKVNAAVARLQIDSRAGGEVRRLSGGNQQKVTIARWVAGGVQTMLCFDPTRGIDIRTKQQIYVLLRDLAEAGAAVLLYTSELKEVQLVCDRAIVIFGGRVVAEIPGVDADEPALLRAAYNLKSDAVMPEEAVAEAIAEPGPEDGPPAADRRRPPTIRERTSHERRGRPGRLSRRGPRWPGAGRAPERVDPRAARVPGRPPRLHQGHPADLRADRRCRVSATSVLPLALAAVAQAIVVIAGGIDLSIGSMMALTSVVRPR